MSKKISNEDLIENLQELYIKLGRVPKKIDIQVNKGSKYGCSAYIRAFGTLANSLLAADLKPHQIRGLEKKDVVEDIKKIYKQLGYTPQHEEYKKYSNIAYSFPTICKLFGSWTKALIAAEVPVSNAGKANKEFILQELQKWYVKNNCDVNCLSYWTLRHAKKNGEFVFSCATIKNHFPNMVWEKIMKQIDPLYETKDPFIGRKSYEGKDGNEYLSLLELRVGDYLCDLKEQNKISDYDYEMPVCIDKLWTCDFVVESNGKKLWLELDGMKNNRKMPYSSGHNEKINYYIENKFDYAVLTHSNNIVNKLNLLLNVNTVTLGGKIFNSSEIDDEYTFFTKEEVYNYHKEHDENWIICNLIIPFYDFLLQYIDLNGWIYPQYNDVEETLKIIKSSSGKLSSSSRVGTQFLKSHFKSFWEASNGTNLSPIEMINNKKMMLYYLKYRFGISNSKKYKYNFGERQVEFNELFDISFKQVRKILEVNRVVVSLFKPLVAKYVYQKYGFEGIRVWDPCAGFGGRLMGFIGSFEKGKYIGNEPNKKTLGELKHLADKLGNKRFVLHDTPIETAAIPKVDLVFTCPPYDFKEHYCDCETQSDVRYKTHNEWVRGFLTTLLTKAYKSLGGGGGKCIIIFDKNNCKPCIEVATQLGFTFIEYIPISNSKTHLNPSPNTEYCLTFSK